MAINDKLTVEWVDLEDGKGLYFRLKDGLPINEVLANTMCENKALKASLMTIASLDDGDDAFFAKKVADTALEEYLYKESTDVR